MDNISTEAATCIATMATPYYAALEDALLYPLLLLEASPCWALGVAVACDSSHNLTKSSKLCTT